ncbi:MAG: hypothetical protein GXY44_11905 [Phycisphaerales bacterium]|nr:hypothetical protein [Phycisphaerales bacterium]
MNEVMTDTLLTEYEAIVADLGMHTTDEHIVHAMIERADWTQEGATAVVMLSRKYGIFMLRNALALANATKIQDGYAGF